jgi:hypothetical protein
MKQEIEALLMPFRKCNEGGVAWQGAKKKKKKTVKLTSISRSR